MNNLFHLKVASREGIVFEGDVESITSFNEKGKFDVLGQHANFISLIKKNLIVRASGEQVDKELSFDNALMRVRENNVEVYLGVEGLTAQNFAD
jgi:F0F1-type ATP synthase epsilon subunit